MYVCMYIHGSLKRTRVCNCYSEQIETYSPCEGHAAMNLCISACNNGYSQRLLTPFHECYGHLCCVASQNEQIETLLYEI